MRTETEREMAGGRKTKQGKSETWGERGKPEEKGARGGRSTKRGRKGTGWRRSRRVRSVQVVAGIPDQYFHRFSGGYRQVASSRPLSNPYPSLVYSDDAIFLFPLLSLVLPRLVHSRCRRLCFRPLLSSSLIFLSFLLLFAPFAPMFFLSALSLIALSRFLHSFFILLRFTF